MDISNIHDSRTKLCMFVQTNVTLAHTEKVGHRIEKVNGKSYNQARLLLGKMGSLHPANRLAAYVTGRLKVDIKNFVIKNNAPKPPQIKVAGTVFPSNFTAKKITALKLPTQQPGQVFAEPWRKQSISLPQQSQNTSTINPAQSFLSNQLTSSSSFQTSSTTSPVSLTVSPSLKSPSFLGQSGTYSFRICPPSNQGARDQKLPGVTLPGGFTLIQLPKPGADGAAQQSEPLNTTNKQKEGLFSFSHLAAQWFGLDSLNKLGSKSVEPGSPTELVCEEKMPTDESDEVNKQMESNLDIASDDFGSDSSDYSADGDEDDDQVDIETVEEVKQEMTIHKALLASRESSDDLGSLREFDVQDKSKGNKRRQNHTVLERLRRNEQRVLFDKLQTVLKCDPRTPRFSLLSMAVKEIHHLVKNSKCLEEKKGMLTKMQSAYVKKLSRLSGKSEKLITHKLKEICDREKRREKMMKWRPVFSQLLQSKAALLQAIAPEPKHQPPPQPQSDSLTPVQANSPITVSKNNIHSFLSLLQARLQNAAAHSRVNTHIPTPQSLPQAASSEAAPSSSAGEHVASVQVSQHPFKEACGDPDKVIMINSQTERQPQAPSASTTLQVTAAQDGASPPNCNDSEARPPLSVTVPLIRSKTGRIILPSSLKPRFYTLVVVKAKEMGEDGEVSSSVDPASNKPLEDKSACSGAESLVKLAFINKSISVPKSESKPEPSPPVSRRQRGGPQKNPVPSVGKDEKPTVEEETRKAEKSEVSMLVEERQGRKMRAKRKPVDTSKVADNPVQVKRRRGRPPKQGSPVKQAAESPSISSEDSPVRLPGGLKDISSSRPLTRGALGKDFPSAKKRSWIDVEKELEPDVESE